jgi:hypothetical protein
MKDTQATGSNEREAIESRGKAKGSELTEEELEAQGGEELPDREAMSLIDANVAAPVNVAAALNVLSDNSKAIAAAEQTNTITQHT